MDLEQVTQLLQETIKIALFMSAPVLVTALGSGLLISIFQAATQINEQTLTFVPKIVLTLAVFAVFFPQLMVSLVDFTQRLLGPGLGAAP